MPSTAAGVITSLALKKGDRVSKGSLIAQVDAKGDAAAAAQPAASGKSSGAAEEPVSTPSLSKEQSERNAGGSGEKAAASGASRRPMPWMTGARPPMNIITKAVAFPMMAFLWLPSRPVCTAHDDRTPGADSGCERRRNRSYRTGYLPCQGNGNPVTYARSIGLTVE